MKWFVRIVGILLLLVAAVILVFLVLAGIEMGLGMEQFLEQAWLPVVVLILSVGMGIYLLLVASRLTPPRTG